MRIEGAHPIAIVAVETATPEMLDIIDPGREAHLLISGERAMALALANERDAADPVQPVLIERTEWLNAETGLAIADPGQDHIFFRLPVSRDNHPNRLAHSFRGGVTEY